MKSVIKSVSTSVSSMEHKVNKTLSNNVMVLRIVLVVRLLSTKYLPTKWLNLLNSLSVRVLCALLIAYLCYVDLISAAIAALTFVVSIQELQTRQATVNLEQELNLQVEKGKNEQVSNNNNQSNVPTGDDGLVAQSSYGNPDELVPRNSGDKITYENQIGELEITKTHKGLSNGLSNGVSNEVSEAFADNRVNFNTAKVNMGQGNQNPNMGGLGAKDLDVKVHPVSRTISENLQIDTNNAFTTSKHLLDIQINSAQGAREHIMPCAVESVQGMWNTQGLKSPITGNDLQALNKSVV